MLGLIVAGAIEAGLAASPTKTTSGQSAVLREADRYAQYLLAGKVACP